MKRRDFIRLSLAGSAALMAPGLSWGRPLDLDNIRFSQVTFDANAAQTIIVYLYGGASQLAGNLTNLDTIERHSQNSYRDYFRGLTVTEHGFWEEAGGAHMEALIASGDMSVYRTCYSHVRETNNNKAHGVCTEQNQKGSFDTDGGGIAANLAAILHAKGAIDSHALMPFVTMEGESNFYTPPNVSIPGYLKPVGINERFENPYKRERWTVRRWSYYTDEERQHENYNHSDEEGGFDPALTATMDRVAQSHNPAGKIKDAFAARGNLSHFIDEIKQAATPDLGDDAYPQNDPFAQKLEAAIKLLDRNSDTRFVTLGTGGLGGWDDHNDARDYVERMERLFRALRSAAAHLRALEKDQTINIMVFGEFGRNVNLNSAHGWDHGNLQNLYAIGGKRYFNHQGVVGETVVENTGSLNRLWLKPKSGSYWFEPISIAATIYRIYGIENPQTLTGGYGPINLV
jgi:hypothetical protein